MRDLHRLSGGASRVTSAFELESAGAPPRRLILQMDRGDIGTQSGKVQMERSLLQAAHAVGVPVPAVVAMGVGDDLGADWLVVERLEGETIPRKILRDAEWAAARRALTAQCGRALAAIHTIEPGSVDGLPAADPLGDPLPFLDALGEARPALELGVRWLDRHRPGARAPGHGARRLPLRQLPRRPRRPAGRARLGAGPRRRSGRGHRVAVRAGLALRRQRRGGRLRHTRRAARPRTPRPAVSAMDRDRVHWWQVHATVKWAVICSLQASAHLSGATRSVELAAIGRRVCESEWDLFTLLGVAPGDPAPEPVAKGNPVAPFGRPTAAELVEAVREYLEADVMERSEGGARFEARVARNALAIVERELVLRPRRGRRPRLPAA